MLSSCLGSGLELSFPSNSSATSLFLDKAHPVWPGLYKNNNKQTKTATLDKRGERLCLYSLRWATSVPCDKPEVGRFVEQEHV